jgi:hypothetical protein
LTELRTLCTGDSFMKRRVSSKSFDSLRRGLGGGLPGGEGGSLLDFSRIPSVGIERGGSMGLEAFPVRVCISVLWNIAVETICAV